jgi:hypothetical protein
LGCLLTVGYGVCSLTIGRGDPVVGLGTAELLYVS